MRPALRLLTTTALLLSLAGCAKDLALPPLRTAPVVTSLTPTEAWAGQLLFLEGSRLDPDPTANVVTFAAATTRGLRFDGTTLVVRVPPDAGSGPIIVTNGSGTSAPFPDLTGTPFRYLGLGEPRRRAVATSSPILHRPGAVHGVDGEVYLLSSLYGGLLAAGDPAFASPPATLSAAAPWRSALYVVEPLARSARLWRIDAASGAATASADLPFQPAQLLPMQLPGVIVAFAGASPDLAAWDLDTLATVIAPTALPAVADFSAAADAGGGLAVVLGLDDAFDVRLFLVDVAGTPLLGPVPAPTLVAGALDFSLLPVPPLVAVAFSDRFGPDGISTGEAVAAVSLSGGDLAVARLGLPDPSFVGTIRTFSTSSIEQLVGAASVPVVLATRPDDGLSVGADLVSRQLLWSVPGNAPGPASATGDLAFVAHGADDEVSVVSLLTGSRVARVSFDVSPGAAGTSYGATTALLPRDPAQVGASDELVFPVGGGVPSPPYFPALVRFSLDTGAAAVISRTPGIGVVAASPAPAAVWAASAAGSAEAFLGRSWTAPASLPLPGAPLGAAAAGSVLALAYDADPGPGLDAGLAVLDGATFVGSSDIGPALALHGVGFDVVGRVWSAVGRPDGELVQVWDVTPLSTVVPGRDTTAAVMLEDGLWLLGGTSPTATTLLGPDLTVYRDDVTLADGIPAVHAVSPNGRLLVFRDPTPVAGATVLRFFRADPDAGFPQIDQILVEGNVEGLAFDGTGERLWLVTRSPDAVVLVD